MHLQQILAQRKHFTHLKRTPDLIDTGVLLEQVNTDSGRYYKTPSGDLYPSVTTVTGIMNAKAIHQWRKRVGYEEANRISSKAATRGTRIHKLFEDYIDNADIDASKYSFDDALNFNGAKGLIDEYLDNVHLQEVRLYSDYLKMAGTVDCIAEWKGKLAIIDFKTARKPKEKSYITNYFCQAAAYAIMYEERYKIPVSRIVILICVDDEPPQIFEEKRDNFTEKLFEVRREYNRQKDLGEIIL